MQEHVYTIAKACSDFGIEHAVISPGSRSAPLVFAFTQNKKISCYPVTDERSAGFIALGIAQQVNKPVVLICTSGTACLNFFPAVAEAFYQRLPLLILTADRPPELLNQQDGQMIMQKNVYGKHVLASHELPCFEHDNDNHELTERIVNNAIIQAMQPTQHGPVHINVPLREPLYPAPKKYGVGKTSYRIKSSDFTRLQLKESDIEQLKAAWTRCSRKLVLVGQYRPDQNIRNILNSFNNLDDVCILADVVSNQHEVSVAPLHDFIISRLDEKTLESLEPDLILSLGGPLISKSLKLWLRKLKPRFHFRLQPEKDPIDTYLNTTHFIRSQPEQFLDEFINLVKLKPKEKVYAQQWKKANERAVQSIGKFTGSKDWSELHVVSRVLAELPAHSNLQLANSTPVRYASLLGLPQRDIKVFGNRGTSGIDGCNSTSVGTSVASSNITTLITGDVAFFYDRNAFWNSLHSSRLRVVMLNNGGGGIFNLIEGPSEHPQLKEFFITPHSLNAASLCEEFGLEYVHASDHTELSTVLPKFFKASKKAAVLELFFDMAENTKVFDRFRNLKF